MEAFLLSRVDASSDENVLALLTGLSKSEVEAGLNRLFDLGAIDFVRGQRGVGTAAVPSRPKPQPPGPASRQVPRVRLTPPPLASPPSSSAIPRRLYDPAELDEDVEIDAQRKRRILDTYYRLGELDHYELLGVDRTADKKKVKSAYYELAPEFHTDKYFGKRLGSYKAKIEAVFSRITLAHDTLTHRQRRAEYDQELARLKPKEAAPASVPPPTDRAPSSGEAKPLDERARRELLARKLGSSARRAAVNVASSAVGEPPPAMSEEDARRAKADRAQQLLRQGHYEVGEGRWSEAAASFEEACRTLTGDAGAHERAAFAMLRAGGIPTKAIELARRAVDLEPSAAEYRLTLARAYLAEGMEKRAQSELDLAITLAPGDATVKRRAGEILENARKRGKVG